MSKIAFLFPGQGAQKAGMGKDFYESCPLSREVFEIASEETGIDMKALCFEENEKLDQTEYTQAALLTASLAMERQVRFCGLQPQVTAGLSLGEYCAIESAGGMDLRDAVCIVRKRGILMEQAVPAGKGSMAAVLGLPGETIEKVLQHIEGVGIANDNCPGQIVISGIQRAVEEAAAELKAAGAKRVLPLNVSGPFHSFLLKEAGEALLPELEKVDFHKLEIPYVTNVTGGYVTEIRQAKELLAKQIYSPVLWQQSVKTMLAAGIDTFVEIGPGRTLTGFVRKISRDAAIYNIQTLRDLDAVLGDLGNKP